MDLPIIAVYLMLALTVILPVVLLMIRADKMFLHIAFLLIGLIWITSFILSDHIELSPQVTTHDSFTNSTMVTDAVNLDLIDENGDSNPLKIFILLFGLLITVMPIVSDDSIRSKFRS